jgi:hypothetical protein
MGFGLLFGVVLLGMELQNCWEHFGICFELEFGLEVTVKFGLSTVVSSTPPPSSPSTTVHTCVVCDHSRAHTLVYDSM